MPVNLTLTRNSTRSFRYTDLSWAGSRYRLSVSHAVWVKRRAVGFGITKPDFGCSRIGTRLLFSVQVWKHDWDVSLDSI